jgi:hypothetical protein
MFHSAWQAWPGDRRPSSAGENGWSTSNVFRVEAENLFDRGQLFGAERRSVDLAPSSPGSGHPMIVLRMTQRE